MWKESQGFCEHMFISFFLGSPVCNGMLLEPSNSLLLQRLGKRKLQSTRHLLCMVAGISQRDSPGQGPAGLCWEGLTEGSGFCSPRFFDIFLNHSRQLQKTLKHHKPFKPRVIGNTFSQESPEFIALVIIQLTTRSML